MVERKIIHGIIWWTKDHSSLLLLLVLSCLLFCLFFVYFLFVCLFGWMFCLFNYLIILQFFNNLNSWLFFCFVFLFFSFSLSCIVLFCHMICEYKKAAEGSFDQPTCKLWACRAATAPPRFYRRINKKGSSHKSIET